MTPIAKFRVLAGAAVAFALTIPTVLLRAENAAKLLPPPIAVEPPAAPGLQTATFAGGCFWGIQGVFEHVQGVTQAVSGYAGGDLANPSYEQVSTGATGHAEAVRVTFDPARVSYARLLQIFFSVALDPTEVDRQGPDWGTQYRSELFVGDPAQERTAQAYIAQLEAAHSYSKPIATHVAKAGPFYPAEAYHQDYLERFPDNGYIAANDIPKVRALERLFPENWHSSPVLVTKPSAA